MMSAAPWTTPLNTPDILPSLLALARVTIPDTAEGEDLSRFFTGTADDEDRAALFMMVAPFVIQDFKAYRGIRTPRYTYVRDSDGQWLLYDNVSDPYQMQNLLDARRVVTCVRGWTRSCRRCWRRTATAS
jgi:arylsulfatase A-like enzyme